MYKPTGAQTYYLGASISSTQTTMRLSSFLVPVTGTPVTMALLGTDIVYGTIAPKTSSSEFVSFTGITQNVDGSATLTGVVRGLAKIPPYTADIAYALPHSGRDQFILSNSPQQINEYAALRNDNTFGGINSFTQVPNSSADPVSGNDLTRLSYVQALVLGTLTTINVIVPGTAGATIVPGNLIYFDDPTNLWKLCDADFPATVENVLLGIAQGAGTNGNPITNGILLQGVDTHQSGLTDGQTMYASNTPGAISNAPGTTTVVVGISKGTTQLYFAPRFNEQVTQNQINALNNSSSPLTTVNFVLGNSDTTGSGLIPRLSVLPYSGFGDGSDGVVTIAAGTTTLTRDMFYQTLTIQTGGIINPNGFRIFVRGTLTYQGTGKVMNNGGAGGTGGAATQGSNNGAAGAAGAAAATAGSLPPVLPGIIGGIGGTASSNGSNGTAGTAVAKSLGATGATGGAGSTGGTSGAGSGPGTGGTAGAGGAQTGTVFNKLNSITSGYFLIDNQPTIVTLTGSASSGGGGGGGGGKSTNSSDCGAGGGGGGSGAPGGIVWIAANTIVTVNGNIYAQADGGAGGAGGAGGNSLGTNGGGGSGGGGGGGGSGGVVIVFYYSKTGTGTTSVAAGAAGVGGALGTKNGTGTDGTAGATASAASAGVSYVIAV